jgi:phosphoribosylaminoimidazole-succinocarboxamide synthase
MMQTAQYLSSDAPIAFLPGSGLETTLTHHHNGVMTYSRYVNGSIFSVPKIQANSNTQILMKNKTGQTEEEFFETVHGLVKIFLGASGSNQGAIDNRIEQAMDLVKSHLMNAVRSEVEELKEKIVKLEETISNQAQELSRQQNDFNREVGRLQAENEFLRRNVDPDVLVQWNNNVQQQQPPQQQPQQPQQQPQQQQQQNQEQQRQQQQQNTQQPPQPPPQH